MIFLIGGRSVLLRYKLEDPVLLEWPTSMLIAFHILKFAQFYVLKITSPIESFLVFYLVIEDYKKLLKFFDASLPLKCSCSAAQDQ